MSGISAKTPKRKAADLRVPDLTQDAAERKRVLNVLAQRRYRERKKEHLKKLESQFVKSTPSSLDLVEDRHSPAAGSSPPTCKTGSTQWPSPSHPLHGNMQSDTTAFVESVLPSPEQPTTLESSKLQGDFFVGTGWVPEAFPQTSAFEVWANNLIPSTSPRTTGLGRSSLPSSPPTMTTGTSPSPTESDDWPRIQGLDFNTALQLQATKTYTFPDEANLEMIQLKLLRGCISIARRMHIDDLVFSLDAKSPFTDPALSGLTFDHLPPNLQPTKTQMTIPHHPILDILPWPVVRDKLIGVFSVIPDLRPPQAKSSTAMLDLVYDLEDISEGVRIWGDDPYVDANWEVGEKVFKNWWWALDSNVIGKSNLLRRARGAPLLGEGFVEGEIR